MVKYLTENNIKIAIVDSEDFCISETQDAVDILGEVYIENCSRIVIERCYLNRLISSLAQLHLRHSIWQF